MLPEKLAGSLDWPPIVYCTIRDAILACARKLTQVSLIYRTESTTKKREKEEINSKKDMLNFQILLFIQKYVHHRSKLPAVFFYLF